MNSSSQQKVACKMLRNKEEIEKRIQQLIIELNEKALEDNILSEDEFALIEMIKEEMTNLVETVIQIIEKDVDDTEYSELFKNHLEQTVLNAIRVAKKNNVISNDEISLIIKLQDFVDKLLES